MPTLSLLTFAKKMEQVRCFTAHTYVCIYVCASPLAENLPEIAMKQKKMLLMEKQPWYSVFMQEKYHFPFHLKRVFFSHVRKCNVSWKKAMYILHNGEIKHLNSFLEWAEFCSRNVALSFLGFSINKRSSSSTARATNPVLGRPPIGQRSTGWSLTCI